MNDIRESKPLTDEEFLEFATACEWTATKKDGDYAKFPHEYHHVKRSHDENLFWRAQSTIQTRGLPVNFFRVAFRQLRLGGYKYWACRVGEETQDKNMWINRERLHE